MSDVAIRRIRRPFNATVPVPGSKSLTNRALVLAALAGGPCTLTNILLADDTRVMLDGIEKLGLAIRLDEADRSVQVFGRGGLIPAESADLFCGNSGTTIRFLAAACSVGIGTFTLDGVERMRQRPIGELVDLLRSQGVTVDYTGTEGYPPVVVRADGLPGGPVAFGEAMSSQFLSAVLMAGPYARRELVVTLSGKQTSWPYVHMTMRLMDRFGVTPELVRDPDSGEPSKIIIPPGTYAPTRYAVEPDASNAAYFFAVAAIHRHATVTVEGLGTESLQGDVKIVDVLKRMGATVDSGKTSTTVTGTGHLEGVDVDLSDMPDQAQTLAVVALFADGPTTLRGLSTLRVKETDRLDAVSAELRKLGATVNVDGSESMTITPPLRPTPAAVDTYDDHRMAMSFAIAGTAVDGITINNAQCVNKTYPEFFEHLGGLK